MTAPTPGQADEIPDAYARYLLVTFPADLADFAQHETAMRWKHLTGEREREFWRSLDAAQEPHAARGDAGTVKHTPTGATWVTWADGVQPPWEEIAEAVSRLTAGGVKVRAVSNEDPGRLAVAVYRDLPELEDE